MRPTRTAASSVALLLLIGAGATACSSDAKSGPITITYATPAATEILNKGEKPLIDAFVKANPGIKVKIEQTPLADYNTKLTTQFRGGGGPDLGRVNHTDIQAFSVGGFLSPLDTAISSQKINIPALIPGLVEVGKVGGKQMTLPLTTDTRVLYSNPRLLKAKGINTPPTTWAELLTDVKKFAGTGVYGYAFSSDTDYALSYETIGPYMKAVGGMLVESDGKTAKAVAGNNAGTLAAVKLVQDIIKTGAVPPGVADVKGDTPIQLFAQDKLAFMLGGPWNRTLLLTHNPKLKYETDYVTTPVPVQKEGDPSGSTAGGWQIGVFKNSKNQEAAGKLLAFMMQKSSLLKLNEGEAFPPLTDGLSSAHWATDPFYKAYNEVLPHSGLPIPPVTRLAEVSAAFENSVTPVLVNPSLSAEDALKAFDDKVNGEVLK